MAESKRVTGRKQTETKTVTGGRAPLVKLAEPKPAKEEKGGTPIPKVPPPKRK